MDLQGIGLTNDCAPPKPMQSPAQAVFEAVLPRHSGDTIPRAPAGILVSVADRLDSLVGLWAAGEAPRASADPFGLRRSAYGMLEVLSLLYLMPCSLD